MTITFRSGDVQTFDNAAVQQKDRGQVIALYDRTTYRIFVEYPANEVVSWSAEELSAESATTASAASCYEQLDDPGTC